MQGRKTEHFKALTSTNHASAIADHIILPGHRIKWDHFDILATGRSDEHCKIKETLLIRDLQQALNENVACEKLLPYLPFRRFFSADFLSVCFHLYLLLFLSLLGTGFPYLILVFSFKLIVV